MMKSNFLLYASIFLLLSVAAFICVLVTHPPDLPDHEPAPSFSPPEAAVGEENAPPVEKAPPVINRLGVSVHDEERNAVAGANAAVQDASGSIRLSLITDEDGFCSFDYTPLIHDSMIVSCSGFFDKRLDLSSVKNQALSVIQVCLESQKRIAGMVVDGSGAAVRDAHISVREIQKSLDESGEPLNAISSEQGAFSFFPVASGLYILSVSHSSFLAKSLECRAGDVHLRIVLKNQADVNVKTVDDRDNPIGGVELTLKSLNNEAGLFLSADRTSVSGECRFQNIPPSRYSLTASAAFLGVSCATEVDVRQVDSADVLMRLQPAPFTLSGRVLEFNAGRPVEAATVVCRSQHKTNSRTLKTRTNPQGEFVFSDLFPGEYSLYLDELEGYMTGDYSAYKGLGIEEPFSLSSYLIESVSDVILWAKPCWRLSGRVLNLQNEPLEKAQVSLQASADRFTTYGYRGPRHIGSETSTGSNGKYEFKGCFDASEKTNVFVTAKHPHYGLKSSPGVNPRPGDQIEINLVFEEEPNVMGKVMDAAGKGISGASVYLYAKAGDFVRPGGFQAADAEGCYAMHVPLGSYQGRAQASGYQMPEDAPVKTIHVSDNDVCTLNFKLVENQNILKGIVVDEDQTPVSRVDVYALPYGNSRRPPLGQWGEKIDQTGEDGIFEVDPAHLDSWDECDWLKLTAVQKSPQEYEPASLYEIRLDSENLTIVLDKKTQDYSFEVYGTVLGSDSRPMQDFEAILFESAVATRTSSQIDKQVYGWTPFHSVNGYFHLKGYDSREGPFLIVARDAKGDKAFSESYHFDPGEVKSGIVIQFQTPYSLSGRIVSDETGEPLEDASIMLQYGVNSVELFQKLQIPGYANMMLSRGGDPRQMRLSGDAPQMAAGKDGRFVIPNLTAPKICLVVMHPGYRVSFHLISRRGEEPFLDMGEITLLNLFAEGSNRDVDVVLH